MESLDLARMERFAGLTDVPAGAVASAIAEPGRQYALYLFHARDDGKWGAHFVVTPGTYRDAVTLQGVPAGAYRLEWIDPVSGAVKTSETVEWAGGDLAVATPPYSIDVALRMSRAR